MAYLFDISQYDLPFWHYSVWHIIYSVWLTFLTLPGMAYVFKITQYGIPFWHNSVWHIFLTLIGMAYIFDIIQVYHLDITQYGIPFWHYSVWLTFLTLLTMANRYSVLCSSRLLMFLGSLSRVAYILINVISNQTSLISVVLSCLFLAAMWSPAGKGLTSWLSCMLCFATFPNLSSSTSELRPRMAPWNLLKPSSRTFYWPFQGDTSFVDLLCFFCLVIDRTLCASVYMCLVVTCWERADLLELVCGV